MQARTGNPTLSEKVFERERLQAFATDTRMTLNGTAVKTGVLVAILLAVGGVSGGVTWGYLDPEQSVADRPTWLFLALFGSMIAAFIVAMITTFRPRSAGITAPLYAAFEGWFIGGLSTLVESHYAGIVVQATALTVGVLVVMLAVYVSRIIRVTDKLRVGIITATGAIAIVYLVSFVLRLFGIPVPYIHDSGLFGILFSLFVVALAAFNLLLDFDFVENGVKNGAPKHMEWYAGFGLLVTLVWLYLELLRLLAKLRGRRD